MRGILWDPAERRKCGWPRRILNFKRMQNFTLSDFDLLLRLIAWFGPRLVTTPHVLSQVSDLTDLDGKELNEVRRLFYVTASTIEELYDPSRGLGSQFASCA